MSMACRGVCPRVGHCIHVLGWDPLSAGRGDHRFSLSVICGGRLVFEKVGDVVEEGGVGDGDVVAVVVEGAELV